MFFSCHLTHITLLILHIGVIQFFSSLVFSIMQSILFCYNSCDFSSNEINKNWNTNAQTRFNRSLWAMSYELCMSSQFTTTTTKEKTKQQLFYLLLYKQHFLDQRYYWHDLVLHLYVAQNVPIELICSVDCVYSFFL